MTTHVIVAIRDSAMNRYAPPAALPSIAFAIRQFANDANSKDPNSNLHLHPQDFELWHLANWDENTGLYSQDQDMPRAVARATDLINKEQA